MLDDPDTDIAAVIVGVEIDDTETVILGDDEGVDNMEGVDVDVNDGVIVPNAVAECDGKAEDDWNDESLRIAETEIAEDDVNCTDIVALRLSETEGEESEDAETVGSRTEPLGELDVETLGDEEGVFAVVPDSAAETEVVELNDGMTEVVRAGEVEEVDELTRDMEGTPEVLAFPEIEAEGDTEVETLDERETSGEVEAETLLFDERELLADAEGGASEGVDVREGSAADGVTAADADTDDESRRDPDPLTVDFPVVETDASEEVETEADDKVVDDKDARTLDVVTKEMVVMLESVLEGESLPSVDGEWVAEGHAEMVGETVEESL